jgi:hypothetical protein
LTCPTSASSSSSSSSTSDPFYFFTVEDPTVLKRFTTCIDSAIVHAQQPIESAEDISPTPVWWDTPRRASIPKQTSYENQQCMIDAALRRVRCKSWK